MRTPKQWVHIWSQSKASNLINSILEGEQIVEAIQKEALSNAMTKISDKKELETAQTIISNQRIQNDFLNQEVIKWREKYHEARRYLRQANKGAERNNLIIQLQSEQIKKLMPSI
jgi:hypothetical protein